MSGRHLLALLLAVLPAVCFSQIESPDSISITQLNDVESGVKPDTISGLVRHDEYNRTYNPAMDLLFPYRFAGSLDLQIPDVRFAPGRARLFSWHGGEMVASGGTRVFPGLMQIDSGALGVYQSAGNFTFYAAGVANKYGYFRGLHTQYGVNGSITYRFTPHLSATIFGEYYFGRAPIMPPAIVGYYSRSTFGGYLDYHINDRWGVQAGVQTVQQVGTNRYQAEPIVTPYYKVSKKVSIGLPVGQILYHLLKR